VNCTNCQSAVPANAVQCPVCRAAVPAARRVLTGPASAPAATSPRRRPLSAATAPSASSPAGPVPAAAPRRAAPTTTVTTGPPPTPVNAPPGTQARARGLAVSLTGRVSGAVSFDQREVGSTAMYLMTLAALAGCVVLAAIYLLKVLTALLLPFLIVIFVISVVVNRSAGFDSLRSTLGFGLSGLGRATPGRPGRPGPKSLDVTRFRITDTAGNPYDCEILGELHAPPPKLNDDVEVSGRRRRDGVLQIRTLRNHVTGTTLRGRVPLSVTSARFAPWILSGVVVVLVLLVMGHGA
jgi:hypothetical protein